MPTYFMGTRVYWVTKKLWRYPDRRIPERLKDVYALNPKPERRVGYD